MLLAVAAITVLTMIATSGRSLIPGRLQSLVEMSYEFVASTVRSSAGEEGMRFFPLVFSLFMFILILNLFGMLPGGFTVTSHIIVTFALAAVVNSHRHRLRASCDTDALFGLFVPSGVASNGSCR
jgi:F-type H+-transporting ATPase subunit a